MDIENLNCNQGVTHEEVLKICVENCLTFFCEQDDDQSRCAPIDILEAVGNFRKVFPVGICEHMLEHGSDARYVAHLPDHSFVYKFYSIEWCSKVAPRPKVSVKFNSDTYEIRADVIRNDVTETDITSTRDETTKVNFGDRIIRINLFNTLFGECTPYTVVGRAVEKTKKGDAFYLVVKQPFIEVKENSGDEAREKLSKWITNKFGVNALEGFTQEPSEFSGYLEGDWYIHPLQIALDDLKNENIFIDAKTNQFFVVDCTIKRIPYEKWVCDLNENNASLPIPRTRFSFDEQGRVVWHSK